MPKSLALVPLMESELTLMLLAVELFNVTVCVVVLPTAVRGKLGYSGVGYACSAAGAVTSRTKGALVVLWLTKVSLALSTATPSIHSIAAAFAGPPLPVDELVPLPASVVRSPCATEETYVGHDA